LLSDGKQWGHIAIGAFVGAGVFGAAAAVLFATAPESRAEKVSLACAPAFDGRTAGARCLLRFR
jgi:hypothetical protein